MPKKKTTSVKKKTAKKTVKKAVKKSAAKKAVKKVAKKVLKQASPKTAKKAAPKAAPKAAKTAAKKVVSKKVVKKKLTKKSLTKKAVAPKTGPTAKQAVPPQASRSQSADSKPAPIVFSLDDVEQLMAAKKTGTDTPVKKAAKKKPAPQPNKAVIEDKPVEQRKLGAASLADILGFNPAEKKRNTDLNSGEIPKRWKKYYKLLIELRTHLRDEISLHTSDTLKHSARDDSGDLSGYGSHQADVGTDTFDRDFALSLVSSEQEALNEIEEAIQRIKKGTYGTCEVTGKAIPAARLTAVPFARFSIEGQSEYEKNRRRKVERSGSTGLFGDVSDAPKLSANDEDE